jgi:hypothetical protein
MLIPSLSLQSISFHGKPNNKILSITNSASSGNRLNTQRKTISAFEARISLIFALASQSTSLSQRRKCYYYYKILPIYCIFFSLFSFILCYVMQLLPMWLLRLQNICFRKDLKVELSKKR